MEDFFLELIAGGVELLAEVLLQLLAESSARAVIRSNRKVAKASEHIHPALAAVGYLAVGVIFGGVSVLVFPHPIFHPSKFHGMSLVISPLLTGLLMSQIGIARRRKGKDTIRIESFGYGFACALGVALM